MIKYLLYYKVKPVYHGYTGGAIIMCGIIGYIGKRNSAKQLLDGLRALEYRGYDSAGLACFDSSERLVCVKSAGRLEGLEAKLNAHPELKRSHCGIGHTRWATHGAPTDANSHPHGTPALMLVHNGIIENHAELRGELTRLGYSFDSETDTEVAAKLLDYYLRGCEPIEAIGRLTGRLRGSYAFGILFADEPNTLFALRSGSPLIVAAGDGESFIASDITAILRSTRDYYQLDEGELAIVRADSIEILKDGKSVEKEVKRALWDVEAAERGGYSHFMRKEIHEEPDAIRRTLSPRISGSLPDFSGDSLDVSSLVEASRLHIVACGTAMHAGLIARGLFNRLAGLPVEVEIASEFRYGDPIIDEHDLVMIISQSGETADSLAALRLAKQKGAHTLAIVNVVGSSIAREADSVLYTLAGPEIAVASTKAYTTQTALLTLLAIECGLLRKRLTKAEAGSLVRELSIRAPEAIGEMLAREDEVRSLAREIKDSEDLFFIGRGVDAELCAEGSLKLKEISYIHSEAYAAGELKHGTLSLIEPGTPVIALLTAPELVEKTASNIREASARGARVLAAGFRECPEAERTLILPEIDPRLAFLPAATLLQLLAYHTALARGCDIDKPRNLAKSVTVE